MLLLLLSYFDTKIGPKLFLKVPENINNNYLKDIPRLMDIHDKGYFIYESGKLRTANLIFQIFNQNARGQKESIMISIALLNDKTDLKIYELLLKNFSFKFKSIDEIYKGFYVEKVKGKSTCEAYEKIKDLTNSLYFAAESYKISLMLPEINLDDKDKNEFIREMMSLSPKEREEVVDNILNRINSEASKEREKLADDILNKENLTILSEDFLNKITKIGFKKKLKEEKLKSKRDTIQPYYQDN